MINTKIFTKLAIVSGALLMSLGLSVPAQASGYYGHNRAHHSYSNYGHRYNRHRGNRYYGQRRNRHHYRRHSNTAAYIAGGLVLGSLITHAYQRNHDAYAPSQYVRRGRGAVNDNRPISRRLYKDRNGNCFERTYTPAGDELLTELDTSQCAW